jgi:serine/threonine-protein kinase RsbW
MTKEIVFKLIATLQDLGRIREFISQRSTTLALDPDTTYNIQLAVVELVTNSLKYGYHEKPGYVEIEIGQQGDKLLVIVRDQAAPFDPTLAPPPDLSVPLEHRRFGGLGIFLVRQLVDEMQYQSLPQGGNQVTLAIHKRVQ